VHSQSEYQYQCQQTARVGFFRWLCMRLAKMVKYKVVPLFVTFMVLSGILAMFIDSITVILFLAAVTIELSQLLKFNPVPMILAEVFCANLGGSATMCGDPPNIIIGTSLGYSFTDFLTNTGVIAGVSLIVVILYFYLVFHKELRASEAAAAGSNGDGGDPQNNGDHQHQIAVTDISDEVRHDFQDTCLLQATYDHKQPSPAPSWIIFLLRLP